MQSLVGTTLGGYQIIERIALGGMAAVYLAHQSGSQREVAIKVLPLDRVNDPAMIERFERESRLLAGLHHPHILPVFDCGRDADYAYLVMPLLRHGDLAERLARWGEALPMGEIRRIGLQLAEALDCAHQQGIVHRDLKPANVLLDSHGNCLLSDFGIAKYSGAGRLTSIGSVIGTPEYMSPEQGTGKPVDARSDLYSLGVILFELATYRRPFEAESPTALILKHAEDPPPLPRDFNSEIPPAFDSVILKALAKSPDQRFQSATELAQAIRDALPEAPPLPATPERASMHAVTRPVPIMTTSASRNATHAPEPGPSLLPIGLAALVLLGAGAWWMSRTRPVAPAAPPAVATPVATPAPATPLPGTSGQSDSAPILAAPAPPAGAPAAPPPEPPDRSATATPAPDAEAAPAASAPPAPATPAQTVVANPVPSADAARPLGIARQLIDRFDDAQFDGEFNDELWQLLPGTRATHVAQRAGALQLSTRENLLGLYAILESPLPPNRIAARLRLDRAPLARQGAIGFALSAYSKGHSDPLWWAGCYMQAERGAKLSAPTCSDIRDVDFPAAADAALSQWHRLEMRIDASRQRVLLSADGAAIGELPLPSKVAGARLQWHLSLTGWSADGNLVSGEIDDIEVN